MRGREFGEGGRTCPDVKAFRGRRICWRPGGNYLFSNGGGGGREIAKSLLVCKTRKNENERTFPGVFGGTRHACQIKKSLPREKKQTFGS